MVDTIVPGDLNNATIEMAADDPNTTTRYIQILLLLKKIVQRDVNGLFVVFANCFRCYSFLVITLTRGNLEILLRDQPSTTAAL